MQVHENKNALSKKTPILYVFSQFTGSVFGSIIAWCMVYAVMKLPQHPRIFYTMATINSENFQPLPQYTDLVDQGRAQPSSQTSIALQQSNITRQI